MNIAETTVPITLDKPRVMVFNANTFSAYEEATGKFFLDTVTRLYEKMFLGGTKTEDASDLDDKKAAVARVINAYKLLREFPMSDLRALLWASLHEYDAADNPHWPLTINQVGRLINQGNVIEIFWKFLKGHNANSPSKETMGESPAAGDRQTKTSSDSTTPSPTAAAEESPSTPPNGGTPGIAVPAGAFD